VAASLKTVALPLKKILQKQAEPISEICFPSGGACSLVKIMDDGQMAEIGTIGSEGVIGVDVFFGQSESPYECIVQVPDGDAEVMSVDAFKTEMNLRGAFFDRVMRFTEAFITQVMQTTACNGLHSAEQRCCRWLLMTHDRAKRDEFPLTHEFLAAMLAVRRPTVTLIAASLQQAGLIQYRRGYLTILNRSGLENAACECYSAVRDSVRRLLPELGNSLS
jgi:CRP-like cAMP-binding protein